MTSPLFGKRSVSLACLLACTPFGERGSPRRPALTRYGIVCRLLVGVKQHKSQLGRTRLHNAALAPSLASVSLFFDTAREGARKSPLSLLLACLLACKAFEGVGKTPAPPAR